MHMQPIFEDALAASGYDPAQYGESALEVLRRSGTMRTRSFVPPDNLYHPMQLAPDGLPPGNICTGDSGGGVYKRGTQSVVGLLQKGIDIVNPCAANHPNANQLNVIDVVELARYTRWIDAVTQGNTPGQDPDCAAGTDHVCFREGNKEVPSCGYLAAQMFGWKILYTPPASELPTEPISDSHAPFVLTSEMIQAPSPYVTEQQMANWHQLHGWRLICQDGLDGQPGWVRLDGYKSSTGFPGSSPVGQGGVWDCSACNMWRGD